MPIKNLLNAIHDTIKWVLHVAVIPVLAVLKALDAAIEHLVAELEKL